MITTFDTVLFVILLLMAFYLFSLERQIKYNKEDINRLDIDVDELYKEEKELFVMSISDNNDSD